MTDAAEKSWHRAQRYLAQGQLVHARAMLESMQARMPAAIRTYLLSAQIAQSEGRMRDAVLNAREAAQLECNDLDQSCEVAEALLRAGDTVALRDYLERPPFHDINSAPAAHAIANFHVWLGNYARALQVIERARALDESNADIRLDHGTLLAINGRLAEGEVELESVLRAAPTCGEAAVALARLRVQTEERNHLDLIEHGLRAAPAGSFKNAAFEFARYKELEDLGRHDEAWAALASGNAIMHALNPHDPARLERYIDELIAHSAITVRESPRVEHDGPHPIFILGMPRSGTTILERILTNHPLVGMGGELVDFDMQLRWAVDHSNNQDEKFARRLCAVDFAELGRRYLAQTQWRARGKPFFTDKQPSNRVVAGIIATALPGARILHMVREPMDVCFSNWRTLFGKAGSFSYDLSALSAYYRSYRRLFAHWHRMHPGRILDVSYTELTGDTEATARKVFAFCGLAWHPECLNIERNTAPVATLSVAQVRSGIHARTSEQWRPYAGSLEKLRAALFQAGFVSEG